MTTTAVLTCDFCGQSVTEGTLADLAWGKVIMPRPKNGGPRDRDICGRCLAEAGGWKGRVPPVLSSRAVARLRTMEVH
jgi:hypothetical protein